MTSLRNLGKAVKIGVTAYITGGIAYWITAEIFIRYIGKEITFSPLVSALLTVPFWPMHVYGDLRWIGVLPQDVVALLVTIFTIILFILDFATRGKYRTRPVALLLLGLSLGTCIGYGVLRIPQPKLAFDLMTLLTFVWMLIWTIRKRHVRARNP